MDSLDKEAAVAPFIPTTYSVDAIPDVPVAPVEALCEPDAVLKFYVWAQWFFDWAFCLPFAGLIVFLMRTAGGYRVDNVRAIRRQFREIRRGNKPLLICLNHLTFIDSAMLMWALAPVPWYFLHFRSFSWNLPAGDFFKKKFIYRVVAFFSKCVFIHRDGSKEHKTAILSVCRYLLSKGEVLSIFPEGKRSRSGRFEPDKVTFGAGKLVANLPECQVLCVYIRGDKQQGYSNYPPRGSRLSITMRLLEPHTERTGRDAYFDLTTQIASTLKEMENQYFESRTH